LDEITDGLEEAKDFNSWYKSVDDWSKYDGLTDAERLQDALNNPGDYNWVDELGVPCTPSIAKSSTPNSLLNYAKGMVFGIEVRAGGKCSPVPKPTKAKDIIDVESKKSFLRDSSDISDGDLDSLFAKMNEGDINRLHKQAEGLGDYSISQFKKNGKNYDIHKITDADGNTFVVGKGDGYRDGFKDSMRSYDEDWYRDLVRDYDNFTGLDADHILPPGILNNSPAGKAELLKQLGLTDINDPRLMRFVDQNTNRGTLVDLWTKGIDGKTNLSAEDIRKIWKDIESQLKADPDIRLPNSVKP
jgi:hypothetical protein